MPPNHSFLLLRYSLRLVRAQLEHGDLVGLDVAEQPFVGVQAVVVLLEDVDRLVDGVGILDGLANARGQGLAVDVEAGLVDGRLADEQAGVVEVIIHAALDAARVGLHQTTRWPLAGLTSSQTL